jgi:type I restriction enzyme S subunit
VCEIIQGQSPPGDTYNTVGEGTAFFQGKAEFGDLYPTPVKWCSKPTKIAQRDDVLISIRAPVGPTNLCPSEACIGRGLAAIRPLQGMPPKYVLYAMRNSVEALIAQATGSTFEAVSGKDLRAHRIPVAPLPEQRRIVAEIEKQFTRLEAGIAALRQVQANLKRYRAAVLKAACDGQLVPGEVPTEKWKEVRLLDICESVTDGDHQPPPKYPNGIPYLTIGNISSGTLDFADTMFVSEDFYWHIKPDRIPRPNDILYTVVGASIGVPVLVNTEKLFCFSRHIALLKPSSKVLPRFLRLLMACPQTFREAWSRTTGSAQPTLALKPLRALPVKLPPLAEQERIVAEVERRLSVVEELSALVESNLKRAARLRQSILQRAFEGKLGAGDRAL